MIHIYCQLIANILKMRQKKKSKTLTNLFDIYNITIPSENNGRFWISGVKQSNMFGMKFLLRKGRIYEWSLTKHSQEHTRVSNLCQSLCNEFIKSLAGSHAGTQVSLLVNLVKYLYNAYFFFSNVFRFFELKKVPN